MNIKTKSKLISAVFVVFIFAVAVLYIFTPKNSFSETEKRYLAEFPEFSFESLVSGKFTSEFEGYLSDHAPFRNVLVSLNSYFELIKGNNGSNGVYLCADGWLIEKPFDKKTAYFRRFFLFFGTFLPSLLLRKNSGGHFGITKVLK